MATECRGTQKHKRINRHKLAVIEVYIIFAVLVTIGLIAGLFIGRHTAPVKEVFSTLCLNMNRR